LLQHSMELYVMNSKERLIAALHGEEIDHIPFSPFLAYVWEYFPREIQEAGKLAFHHAVGADPLWRGGPCPAAETVPPEVEYKTIEEGNCSVTVIDTPVGSLRKTRTRSEAGGTDFLVEHPLKSEEDYKVQMWIEEHTVLKPNSEKIEEHFRGDGREGLSLGMLIPRGKSAYQFMVEHLAGTEELIYAVMDFPDTVLALREIMVDKDREAVRIALESKFEYFTTWEDSSTQNYSPAQYDDYIGSEISEWCSMLESRGKRYIQHACGHVAALLEPMKENGVFAVESLSPPPTGNISVRDARAIARNDMGIIGGIEPTEFLNLSEKELGTYAESVIDEAKGGPFVLANSDSCPPGVTVEKFRLVSEVARTCG